MVTSNHIKRKTPPFDRAATIDTLTRGLRELIRQGWALTHRVESAGEVICTIRVPVTLHLKVPSPDDRDSIIESVQQALAGLPGVNATMTPEDAQVRWNILTEGR